MADNVTIPVTGTGTATPVIATDDVSGVQFQKIKLDGGGDGASLPIKAGTDDAAADTLPVGIPIIGKVQVTAKTYTDGDWAIPSTDLSGFGKVTLAAAIAGEDLTHNVMKVENQYSYSRTSVSTMISSTAGFVHTMTFAAMGSVKTGLVTLYDNSNSNGTIVFSGQIQPTPQPNTIQIDAVLASGIYIAYDATISSVQTTLSYR